MVTHLLLFAWSTFHSLLGTKRPPSSLPTVLKHCVHSLTFGGDSSFQEFCRSSSISENISRTSSTWIITRSQNPARSCDVVWNCSAPSWVYIMTINNQQLTRRHMAKQYAFHQWQFDGDMSMVQPPNKCP